MPPPPDWLFSHNSTSVTTSDSSASAMGRVSKELKKAPGKTAAYTAASPSPSPQLLDLVESFLSDHSFAKAHREFKQQRERNGWHSPSENPLDNRDGAHHSLVSVFQAWETSLKDGDGTTALQDAVKKVTRVSSSSSDADTSDESDEDGDVDMKDNVDNDDASSESSSSSDSSSEDETESEVVPVPALKPAPSLKRKKAPASSSDSSESESSSDDSSSSGDKKPRSKKQRVESSSSSDSGSSSSDEEEPAEALAPATRQAAPPSSSSSSSSESDSDSDSDLEVKEAAKVPLPETSDSSSESSSDDSSDSELEKPTEKEKNDSDTSATLEKTSPEFFPVSKFAPLPPDPSIKLNNRGKKEADAFKTPNQPFSRIRKDVQVDPRLASNAFNAHGWGQKAHDDLVVTKGKDFTKEKNKKKRGSYRGGLIDTSVRNGIKFD